MTRRKADIISIGYTSNERFHRDELTHKSKLLYKMWNIGQSIHESRYIEKDYKRTKYGEIVIRKVKPVKADFDVMNDAFTTIYRIDRKRL